MKQAEHGVHKLSPPRDDYPKSSQDDKFDRSRRTEHSRSPELTWRGPQDLENSYNSQDRDAQADRPSETPESANEPPRAC